jgi:oxygen-independent coproporphyrinogen-3 oxidase
LGLGPSAHSFVDESRWWNRRKLRLWQTDVDMGEKPIEDRERPTAEQFVLEALMLGFRTTAGVDIEKLHRRFGIDLLPRNEYVIDQLSSSGHLEIDGARLRPTLVGLAVADTLARSFVV